MSYVGSNPITQFFLEGTDAFLVTNNVSTTVFTMTRPVPTINSISVTANDINLLPLITNYTVNDTTLTLVAPAVLGSIVYVRYLTASNYSITPTALSLNVNVLATTGTPTNLTFLRGDSAWAAPIGTVSNVSLSSPASLAFSIANPTTTPVISFANVTTPASQYLRGDGTWVAPPAVTNVSFSSPASVAFSVATPSTTPVISFNGVTSPASQFLRGDGTWVTPAGAGTVTNVSFSSPASAAFSIGTPSSAPIISFANVGLTPTTVFLRGDGTWIAPTGGVSNVSFTSPASLAFSVATPGTTPAISFSNVTSASTQFLRGDGTWVVPTSLSNVDGWAVAQSGSKLAFTFNGTLVASLGSNGLFTSANNVTAFGTP